MTPSPRIDSPLYRYMRHSHAHVRGTLDRLLDAMEIDAREEVAREWNTLDEELLSHMEAEERFVLPEFAHVDANEALALLREHGLIRARLLELGVAVDLHCIRYEWSRDLAELLDHHARREERLLYRWADGGLAPEAIASVWRHVKAV